MSAVPWTTAGAPIFPPPPPQQPGQSCNNAAGQLTSLLRISTRVLVSATGRAQLPIRTTKCCSAHCCGLGLSRPWTPLTSSSLPLCTQQAQVHLKVSVPPAAYTPPPNTLMVHPTFNSWLEHFFLNRAFPGHPIFSASCHRGTPHT